MKQDKITYEINGAVFEVNKILGQGFLEKVYELQSYAKALLTLESAGHYRPPGMWDGNTADRVG